jgi:glycosyltransferase involved in cell wall biosynthesis
VISWNASYDRPAGTRAFISREALGCSRSVLATTLRSARSFHRRRRLQVFRASEFVTPSPGGKEVHVRELSRNEALLGHSVTLFYRVGGESDWPFDAVRLLPSPVWRRLPHPVRSSLFLAAAVVQATQRRDVISVAHFHGDYLEALAAGAVRLVGIPSLLTLHGRLSPRVMRTLGFVYRLPSHVVAVSPAITAQLKEVGLPRHRLTVQPSGVDSRLFFPPNRAPDMPPFRIVVASALIELKDHASLFQAVRLLQDDGLDVRLEVAGTGPERKRLEQLAPSCTHFHGQLDRHALANLFRSCHVAALASIDTSEAGEGTPTFLMEALACGLPFVATETGGVPWLGARSRAGLVVPQRAPRAFASALRRLAMNEEFYVASREAALAFRPKLDWRAVAQRLESLMAAVVDASSCRTAT